MKDLVDFQPYDCDSCPPNSKDYYSQSRMLAAIEDDLTDQGRCLIAAAFGVYSRYSLYYGHYWRQRELGNPELAQLWTFEARDLYESLPEWAKWA